VKIPRWLPPVAFGVVTLTLFAGFVFSSDMLFGTDTQSLGYMARAFYADALRTEGFPLWNPYILGGTPFLEALSGGDSLYPLSAPLLLVMDTYRAIGWKLVLHVFLAGLFMYGWVRTLGLSRGSALFAGLAFAMAPYMVSLVYNGQDGKIFVTALTPLMFLVTERLFAHRRMLDFAAVSGVVGLIILTTHFQMAYFLFGAAGAYAVFRVLQDFPFSAEDDGAVTERQAAVGTFAAFIAAALLGAGVSAVQLLPSADYVTDSSRRTATTVQARSDAEKVAYSSSWSLHPEEIVGLAVPEFVGGSNSAGTPDWFNDTYWGRNDFKTNTEYVGILVLLMAGLAFFSRRRRGVRRFLVGLGGVSLLFALGTHTPVWGFLFNVVPGIGLFRAPSLTIFLVGFSLATLAAFGIERLLEPDDDETEWKGITWYSLGAVGLATLVLLAAATGGLFTFWTTSVYPEISGAAITAMELARPHAVRGFLIAMVVSMVVAAAVWVRGEERLPAHTVFAVLCIVLVVDLFRIDADYIITQDFEAFDNPGGLIQRIVDQEDPLAPTRTLSMIQSAQDVRPAQFGIELAGGHHPNDLQRYRELIGMRGSGLPEYLPASPRLLDILNIGWMLWPAYRYRPLDEVEGVPPALAAKLERVGASSDPNGIPLEVLYRVETLPRARLVNRVDIVPEGQVVDHILRGDFDPATEIVMTEVVDIRISGLPFEGSVEYRVRENNRQVLAVRTSEPAFLVVAENWYPAWKATVSGEPAPVYRANHTLRAIPVPAGEHEVVMEYRSDSLRSSLWISLASLLILGAVALVGWRRTGVERGEAAAA